MPDKWAGLDSRPAATDRWAGLDSQPMPAQPERLRGGTLGTPGEELYPGELEGTMEQWRKFVKQGGRPEESGLQQVGRPQGASTPRIGIPFTGVEAEIPGLPELPAEAYEEAIRLGPEIAGAMTLGPAAFPIAGSVAEMGLSAIDRATGQEDVMPLGEAALRGAKHGAITGASALAGGLGARGVGKLAGNVSPRLAGLGSVAGDVGAGVLTQAGLEGRLPGKEELGTAGALSLAFRGAGALGRRFPGGQIPVSRVGRPEIPETPIPDLRAPAGVELPPEPGPVRVPEVEPLQVPSRGTVSRGVGREAEKLREVRTRPVTLETAREQAPEDFEALAARLGGYSKAGDVSVPDLEVKRRAVREAEEGIRSLERPRSVGEEYRDIARQGAEEGTLFTGEPTAIAGGAFTKEGKWVPSVAGGRPPEPPDLVARRTDPDTGKEWSVAWAGADEAKQAGYTVEGKPYKGYQGFYVYSRRPGEDWQITGERGFPNENAAIEAMHRDMEIPESKYRSPTRKGAVLPSPEPPKPLFEKTRAQQLEEFYPTGNLRDQIRYWHGEELEGLPREKKLELLERRWKDFPLNLLRIPEAFGESADVPAVKRALQQTETGGPIVPPPMKQIERVDYEKLPDLRSAEERAADEAVLRPTPERRAYGDYLYKSQARAAKRAAKAAEERKAREIKHEAPKGNAPIGNPEVDAQTLARMQKTRDRLYNEWQRAQRTRFTRKASKLREEYLSWVRKVADFEKEMKPAGETPTGSQPELDDLLTQKRALEQEVKQLSHDLKRQREYGVREETKKELAAKRAILNSMEIERTRLMEQGLRPSAPAPEPKTVKLEVEESPQEVAAEKRFKATEPEERAYRAESTLDFWTRANSMGNLSPEERMPQTADEAVRFVGEKLNAEMRRQGFPEYEPERLEQMVRNKIRNQPVEPNSWAERFPELGGGKPRAELPSMTEAEWNAEIQARARELVHGKEGGKGAMEALERRRSERAQAQTPEELEAAKARRGEGEIARAEDELRRAQAAVDKLEKQQAKPSSATVPPSIKADAMRNAVKRLGKAEDAVEALKGAEPPAEPPAPPPPPPGGGGGEPPRKPRKRVKLGKEPIPPGEEGFTEGHRKGLESARHVRKESAKSTLPGFERRSLDDPEQARELVESMTGLVRVKFPKNPTEKGARPVMRDMIGTRKPPTDPETGEVLHEFKLEAGAREPIKAQHKLITLWETDEAGNYLREGEGYKVRSFQFTKGITIEGVGKEGKRIRVHYTGRKAKKVRLEEEALERAGEEAGAGKPPREPPAAPPAGTPEGDDEILRVAWDVYPERLSDDGVDLNEGRRERFIREATKHKLYEESRRPTPLAEFTLPEGEAREPVSRLGFSELKPKAARLKRKNLPEALGRTPKRPAEAIEGQRPPTPEGKPIRSGPLLEPRRVVLRETEAGPQAPPRERPKPLPEQPAREARQRKGAVPMEQPQVQAPPRGPKPEMRQPEILRRTRGEEGAREGKYGPFPAPSKEGKVLRVYRRGLRGAASVVDKVGKILQVPAERTNAAITLAASLAYSRGRVKPAFKAASILGGMKLTGQALEKLAVRMRRASMDPDLSPKLRRAIKTAFTLDRASAEWRAAVALIAASQEWKDHDESGPPPQASSGY